MVNGYILDCDNLHFEAYKFGRDLVIVITTEGSSRKTYVSCDFLHELQHLKRLEIAGIKLPSAFMMPGDSVAPSGCVVSRQP